jgi:hypothetical protein
MIESSVIGKLKKQQVQDSEQYKPWILAHEIDSCDVCVHAVTRSVESKTDNLADNFKCLKAFFTDKAKLCTGLEILESAETDALKFINQN